MKPLIVLIAVFAIASIVFKVATANWHLVSSGNIAMAAMLGFTAIAHFAFAKGMEMMMPAFIPFKKQMVWLTGLLEIAGGVGLLLPQTRYLAAVCLIIFFVLILPANISAALRRIDYQRGTADGNGPAYLWFRVPLQVFFIGWVYFFGIYL
jgi:uncharacterized membrane protein